ncbi:HK97 family phage prohead protease [Actinomyces faecalis]|uniref:HK97 family phage prohead protease n=1 Tax=Actinomyces faecalis TaxID=2722820 RepID=UPI0015571591|nr:HK97 family phage prohead protease [Actinomyces faecalis]
MTLIRRDVPVSLTTRHATTDDVGTAAHVIEGVAVPLSEPTTIIPGYREQIAPGAVDTAAPVSLFYRHGEPIGVVTRLWEDADALRFEATVSDTALGRDAYTLARDGAIRSASIGFYEREWDDTDDDGTTLRTQTRIDLREISLVPVPAYEGAQITNVRHHTDPKGTPMSDLSQSIETIERAMDDNIQALDTLARRLSLLEATATAEPTPARETRSAGALIKAAAAKEDSEAREAARTALAPFVGRAVDTTTADDARYEEPTFISDLTRLIDNANPLASLFATGTLPSEGNTIEFARLKSNSLKVSKQAKEGDTLPTGTISTETDTAKIATYGGASVLSMQTVQRSRSNILDLTLRGLAIEAGRDLATNFATFFESVVSTRASEQTITTTKAAAALDWRSVLALLLDGSEAYEDIAMTCDGLVLTRAAFEALAGMTGTDGRPILAVASSTGANQIGTVSAAGKYISLDGLKVVTNRYLTSAMGEGVVGAFYNRQALRTYATPVASLQDTGIYDLTAGYSVYRYAAFADEIPAAIIPVKMGA